MSVWSAKKKEERQKDKNNNTHTHAHTHILGIIAPKCPECNSNFLYKDGFRYLKDDSSIQRWLCRKCGFRFSNRRESSNTLSDNHRNGKYAVTKPKNLSKALIALTETTENVKTRQAGATKQKKDVTSKIIEYLFWMQKQGYSEATINLHNSCLKVLSDREADLLNPESVKEVIAKQKWSGNRKRNVINAYDLFLKNNGLQWEKPKYHISRKIPFIPLEEEIDDLIAGCGNKTATFLQLLKETAMRSGEAKRLKWVDIDFERNIVTLNFPEKGSNPRIWKVNTKLIAMLNNLPKKSQRLFGDGPITSLKTTFLRARKRLANKLQNPRLLKISFHTIRHWKATMLYLKTKDPYYVKQFLGHKSLKSTEIYINIANTIFDSKSDEFTVKVVEKTEDVKALLEVGFEYVCQKENLLFFRKRK